MRGDSGGGSSFGDEARTGMKVQLIAGLALGVLAAESLAGGLSRADEALTFTGATCLVLAVGFVATALVRLHSSSESAAGPEPDGAADNEHV